MRSLTLIKPPALEPLTLAQLRAHLRIDATMTDDDALLTSYISAARHWAERYTNRAFFPQQWRLNLDHFPLSYEALPTVNPSLRRDFPFYAGYWNQATIGLSKPRVTSIDSITYLDQTGATQTLDPSSYIADLASEPARILPAPS